MVSPFCSSEGHGHLSLQPPSSFPVVPVGTAHSKGGNKPRQIEREARKGPLSVCHWDLTEFWGQLVAGLRW